jgi:hypothetical protein
MRGPKKIQAVGKLGSRAGDVSFLSSQDMASPYKEGVLGLNNKP